MTERASTAAHAPLRGQHAVRVLGDLALVVVTLALAGLIAAMLFGPMLG
ncbi:MAG: hypothetical protein ACXVEU_04750 [Nocardioidaceae bacterium]